METNERALTELPAAATRRSWKHGRDLSGNHPAIIRHNDSWHPDPRDIDAAYGIICRLLTMPGDVPALAIDRGYQDVPIGARSFVTIPAHRSVAYSVRENWRDIAGMLHKYRHQLPSYGGGDPVVLLTVDRATELVWFHAAWVVNDVQTASLARHALALHGRVFAGWMRDWV